MFMFRSRRAALSRRLARRRRCGGGGDDDAARLLADLQDNQLALLWAAVEGGGGDRAGCVLLPAARPGPPPHFLCCRAWRWPDLVHDGRHQLRRLPVCASACDKVYVCCNPYHWSRLYQPETPPPPYTRRNVDKLKPEDRAPRGEDLRVSSLTTNGDDCYRNPSEWCKLAYWELAQRVGPLYPVDTPAVNIFGDVPYGDGLSLETLAQQNCNAPESVRHARCKIGLGVTLSREGGSVWVYNRSDNPIFVNSLTLDDSSHLPTRVPAEQCLCVFDPGQAALSDRGWPFATPFGPVDPHSIRISFAKGWGPRYCRQEITACPCWLEILLAPCR